MKLTAALFSWTFLFFAAFAKGEETAPVAEHLKKLHFSDVLRLENSVELIPHVIDLLNSGDLLDGDGHKVTPRRFGIAWESVPAEGPPITLDRPSAFELLSIAAKKMNLKPLFLERAIILVPLDLVVKERNAVMDTKSRNLSFILGDYFPNQVFVEMAPRENVDSLVTFLNGSLQRTVDGLNGTDFGTKVKGLSITSLLRKEPAAPSGSSPATANLLQFRGYWRYLDFMYAFGLLSDCVFREKDETRLLLIDGHEAGNK